MENDFITRAREIIEDNLSNEKFGVSELAQEIGMSRSNLLRKFRKFSNLSASRFIRNVRLENAMEMLKDASLTVSEISFKVGFSSTSYFIRCFREQYGYPPGEAAKRDLQVPESLPPENVIKHQKSYLFVSVSFILLAAVALLVIFNPFKSKRNDQEKSIAVLPFINDSDDFTNVYIINGLMESVLNNLQKINDLRVISRTSVEKYRNSPKLIPEIAKELNVRYFVEGSGQKIGNQIVLSIQLIEGSNDQHLWSQQYNREVKDIFKIQRDVAENIANQIKVIITPAEKEQIDKIPTDNLEAYDLFLKGLDYFYSRNREDMHNAIGYFRKAVTLDNKFARAYADMAISYYFLDIYQTEKLFADSIIKYADKALLNDPKLPQSLMAKAYFFIHQGSYRLAEPYLEKALEYHPNSAMVINTLADFYANYLPNTEKYLEYAVRGIRLDITANDSVTASFIYLHVSNAFIQTGFTKEAEYYIDKSLDYNPKNIYSAYVKAYILYSKNKDLLQTKNRLIGVLKKDTNRLDVLQEVGKICYYMRDYEEAYHYYKRFNDIRESQHLNVYYGENAKIGLVYSKLGKEEEADNYFQDFKTYADNDASLYKNLSLAVYFSYKGNSKKAIEHLHLFSNEENYHYWIILFLKIDPLIDPIKNQPEFKTILSNIEDKFWERHKQMRRSLKEKGLI